MKHIKLKAIFSLLFSSCLVACQTNAPDSVYSDKVKLTFVESDYFTLPTNELEVKYNANVKIKITFTDGFVFKDCDFPDYDYEADLDNTGYLVMNHVTYPQRVTINWKARENGIIYDLNGGHFANKDQEGDYFVCYYDLSTHLRANTNLGQNIIKDSSILVGWNTEPDGSGEHIGLGSRMTLNKEVPIRLYAEWKPVTDYSYFDYEIKENAISLTKYKGPAEINELVLPNIIDHVPVTKLSSGFCSDVNIKHLYIPSSITELYRSCFSRCQIDEITLHDVFTIFQSSSFDSMPTIKKWHINAASNPCYYPINDNSRLADDIDRLIMNQGKRKMLFFAGCSMSYGLKSELVDEHYNHDYVICDMGVIGGTNADIQFDMITPFIEEGDYFIHAPEVASQYQLEESLEAENRQFVIAEANYDLLSYGDMSRYSNVYTEYGKYCESRLKRTEHEYEEVSEDYNDYGDIIIPRPYTGEVKSFYDQDQYEFHPEMVNATSMGRLAEKYQAIQNKGATVYFSYSPTNYSCISQQQVRETIWNTFASNVESYLANPYGIKIISSVTTYLGPGDYFYDRDYHLNDVGAMQRTQNLMKDIDKAMLAGS